MSNLDKIPPIEDAGMALNFALTVAMLELLVRDKRINKTEAVTRALQLINFFTAKNARFEAYIYLEALDDLFDGQTLYRPGNKLPPLTVYEHTTLNSSSTPIPAMSTGPGVTEKATEGTSLQPLKVNEDTRPQYQVSVMRVVVLTAIISVTLTMVTFMVIANR